MACETPTQFLDVLRSTRLLSADQLAQLESPQTPQSSVEELGSFLEEQGWLTGDQVEQIRQGEGPRFGNYEIIEKLGDARSGPVYRVSHESTHEVAVLKILRAEWFDSTNNREDYLTQLAKARELKHPHVVGLLDFGQQGNDLFVVLEYFDGVDLGWLVSSNGSLEVGQACRFARQVAEALSEAHELGIIHGEVRPGSVLITPIEATATEVMQNGAEPKYRPAQEATAKVMEVGLAPKPTPPGPDFEPTLLAYLPPERMDTSDLTPATDIYGLGVTLYLALAGKPAFGGRESATLVSQIRYTEPTALTFINPVVPPELARVIERMIAKDPTSRPTTATEVIELLTPFTTTESAPAFSVDLGDDILDSKSPDSDVPIASETMTPITGPPMAQVAELDGLAPIDVIEAEAVGDSPDVAEATPVDDVPDGTPVASAAWVPHTNNLQQASGSSAYVPPIPTAETTPSNDDPFSLNESSQATADQPSEPRRRANSESQAGDNALLWIVLGVVGNLLGIGLLLAYMFGAFDSKPEPNPKTTPRQEDRSAPSRAPRSELPIEWLRGPKGHPVA